MMRIEIRFERPLLSDAKQRAVIAIGALAKARRIRFTAGDRTILIYGEALGLRTVTDALAEMQLTPSSATTSLDESAAAAADEIPDAATERVKAIGR